MKRIILFGILLILATFVTAKIISVGITPTDETFDTKLNSTEKTTLRNNNIVPYWNGSIEIEDGKYYSYFFTEGKPFRVELFHNFDREKYWSYADGEKRLSRPMTLRELINDRMKYKQDQILKREITRLEEQETDRFNVGRKDIDLR